jgi:orotate phosphoribosyltransferase
MMKAYNIHNEEVDNILDKREAIITNSHFVYAKKADGWYHGPDYVSKEQLYKSPLDLSYLCREMIKPFHGVNIEVVVGPTIGGVSLSQWFGYWLSVAGDKEVLSIFAEEEDVLEDIVIRDSRLAQVSEALDNFSFNAMGPVKIFFSGGRIDRIETKIKTGTNRVLKRGYEKDIAGKFVLIVEDVINSGGTVVKTINAVKKAEGEVVGVAAIANRSGGKVTAETLGVPFLFSLKDLSMPMYPEDDCPICHEKGIKSVRTELGKGREFLLRKGVI